MSLSTHMGAVLCVALIAAGQVLFKVLASALQASGNAISMRAVLLGMTALSIYAVATLFWIYLLQAAPLARLYPYMALSFVLVALASWLLLHETVTAGHVAGLSLIVAGVFVVAVTGPQ